MKKEICIIVNGYPTTDDPVYAFIQPVAREMADAGISCTVIAPQSVSKMAVAQKAKRPYRWIDKTEKGNEVVVYQPEYVSVSNDKIVMYLNAADMFVLPTLAEGCCNAIVEAMACGLPVISSDRPFNDDILDESCSIRIDPSNIEELSDAIALLKNDPELREKLSEGALSKAKGLTIEQRAAAILQFIDE